LGTWGAWAAPREHVGAWLLSCEGKAPYSYKECVISQSVADANAGKWATVVFGFNSVAETFLRVIAPRSIELTHGIVVAANGDEILTLRVQHCNNLGCISEHTLASDELTALTDRPSGGVSLSANENQGYILPVTFDRLGEALDLLAKRTGVRFSLNVPASAQPKVVRVLFTGVRRTAGGADALCSSEASITTSAVLKVESAKELDAKLENVRGCNGSVEQVVDIDSSGDDASSEVAVAEYLSRKGVGTIRLSREGTYETFVSGR
jgi:invasion protein IalB